MKMVKYVVNSAIIITEAAAVVFYCHKNGIILVLSNHYNDFNCKGTVQTSYVSIVKGHQRLQNSQEDLATSRAY